MIREFQAPPNVISKHFAFYTMLLLKQVKKFTAKKMPRTNEETEKPKLDMAA